MTRDGTDWILSGSGVTVGKLAISVARSGLDRPVIDRTGLVGGFDLQLRWAEAPVNEQVAGGGAGEPAGLSIFTAVKEQLGLRLEPAKAPVEMLVIDHVEKPSEN